MRPRMLNLSIAIFLCLSIASAQIQSATPTPSVLAATQIQPSILTPDKPPPSPTPSVSPTPKPPIWILKYARGRIYSLSTRSPFSRVLQTEKDFVESNEKVVSFLDNVFEEVSSLRLGRSSLVNPDRREQKQEIVLCSAHQSGGAWRSATDNEMTHRGFHHQPRHKNRSVCVTDVFGVGERNGLSIELLINAVARRTEAIKRNAKRLMMSTVGNWTYVESPTPTIMDYGSQQCKLQSVTGFRVRGKWYIICEISNAPSHFLLKDGARFYIAENLRSEKGRLVAINMTLPIRPESGMLHKFTLQSTTVMTRWGGSWDASQFSPARTRDNEALQAALRKADNYMQLTEDAITPSNLAILAMPMLLTFVPLALITKEGRKRMLFYMMLSDILTALPMLIKGIELLQIAHSQFNEVVTRVGETSGETDVVAEIWVAKCRVRGNSRSIGIALVTVSLVSMAFGLALEVWAKRWLKWKHEERTQQKESLKDIEHFERIHLSHDNYRTVGHHDWWLDRYADLESAQHRKEEFHQLMVLDELKKGKQ